MAGAAMHPYLLYLLQYESNQNRSKQKKKERRKYVLRRTNYAYSLSESFVSYLLVCGVKIAKTTGKKR